MSETEEFFGKPIYTYTDKQAEEDGYLVNIVNVNKEWEKGLFNYVTIGLMNDGYIEEDKINIPNLLDLLNQSNQIVKKASNNFKDFDRFFSGEIELPSGLQQKIFIAQNGTGKFTIMLPSDN